MVCAGHSNYGHNGPSNEKVERDGRTWVIPCIVLGGFLGSIIKIVCKFFKS